MKRVRVPYLTMTESIDHYANRRMLIDYADLSYFNLNIELVEYFEDDLVNPDLSLIGSEMDQMVEEFWKNHRYKDLDFLHMIDHRIVDKPTQDPDEIYLFSLKVSGKGTSYLEYTQLVLDTSIRMHTWIMIGITKHITNGNNVRYQIDHKKDYLNDYKLSSYQASSDTLQGSEEAQKILRTTARDLSVKSDPIDMLLFAYQWVDQQMIEEYNKKTNYMVLNQIKQDYCPKKSIEEIEQFMIDLPIREAGRLDALVAWCDEHDEERNLLDIF